MICGGAEAAITPMGVGGFAAMKALSTRNEDPEHACRPFDKDRDGFVVGEGAGILIYEQQEGRGIGLMAKLQAYELQDAGLDTVEANERLGFKADQRDFTLPGAILKALGVTCVRLLSNNPDKVEALERSGVHVVERVPCEVTPSPHAEEYLRTKKQKLGHLFTSSET